MMRWLAWRLAPLSRGLLAPDLTLGAYREELMSPGREDWLLYGSGTWFVAMGLAVIGDVVTLPFADVSQLADAVSRGFLALVGVCLLPLILYSLAYRWQARAERKHH